MEDVPAGSLAEGRSTHGSTDAPRTCVILDTNQWIQHLMLRSPTAAAVLYSLRQQDGVLGLPYVIEEELRRHAVDKGRRARDQVVSGLDALGRLLGSAPAPTLPGDDVLDRAASTRLDELAPFLVRVPFTFEQAQDALRRLLDKVPPNSEKDQQYKDTLIWGGVLALAADSDVLFVTSDKGFFADRDPSKGLAPELLADLEPEGLTVTAVHTLGAAAERLRLTEPPVDLQTVVRRIDDVALDVLRPAAAKSEFTVGPLVNSSVQVYATENPDVIAVAFTIAHALDDIRDVPRTNAEVVVGGDCVIQDGQVGEFRPTTLTLDWVEPSGQPGLTRTVFARMGMHLGERHEPYRVRAEILLPPDTIS
jgi:hypothetical protein